MLPRVRQGIQFTQKDDINGELQVIGDDDAALLLWAAQWLDEHREYMITAIRVEHPAESDDDADDANESITLVVDLTSAGQPSEESGKPRFGPWSHGVPPMPL